jgi:hypothetical protein
MEAHFEHLPASSLLKHKGQMSGKWSRAYLHPQPVSRPYPVRLHILPSFTRISVPLSNSRNQMLMLPIGGEHSLPRSRNSIDNANLTLSTGLYFIVIERGTVP